MKKNHLIINGNLQLLAHSWRKTKISDIFLLERGLKPPNPLQGLNHENLRMDVIGEVFKRKKSPFLMTFLFAPLIGGMLQPFSLVELAKIRKLIG